MTRAAVLLLLALALPAQAQSLSSDEVKREAAYAALAVADWAQTRYTAKHYDQTGTEINPMLGRTPSLGRVNNYFAATLVFHAAVTYLLPPRYRSAWQYTGIVFEAVIVGRNAYIGVGMQF